MSKDLERSLKDRVRAIAKEQNRAFNDVWKALALERFLARLSRSDQQSRFIFKGGFLLSKYMRLGRETTDLDFSLSGTEGTVDVVKALIDEILTIPYEDGFSFEGLGVLEMNHPHMNYPGYEVSALAVVGGAKTSIRIDLGIGDKVEPQQKLLTLLSLNNKPLFEHEISLQAYPISYIFAEKLEAIVYRGGSNSRMKDFYDLITLSNFPEFDLGESSAVIYSVFSHRGTTIPKRLIYDQGAVENLSRSWKRFLGALEEEFRGLMPEEFVNVIDKVDEILGLL